MIINDVILNVNVYEILEELQRQLSINKINLITKIRPTSKNAMITCPYHKSGQERKPSAGVSESDGTFHCFTCGEVHTLPEMISYCFGYRDDYAGSFGWKWLTKNFLSINIEDRKDVRIDFDRHNNKHNKHSSANRDICDDAYITDSELESYRYYHQYMYKRKLTDEIIDLFDIGYDKKTKCITFPIRDEQGNCLIVARRSVYTKYFNYPSGSAKPVYGLYELSLQEEYPSEVVICESMLDALTIWVYGGYAVALNGLGTKEQYRQLSAMPCRKFILATDNDEAGMKARERIKRMIKGKIITEYILPKNKKDINELTLSEYRHLKEVF